MFDLVPIASNPASRRPTSSVLYYPRPGIRTAARILLEVGDASTFATCGATSPLTPVSHRSPVAPALMTQPPIGVYRTTHHCGVSTVALAGELDPAVVVALRLLLIEQIDLPAITTVTADLAQVPFMDSAALGALIAAYQHASVVASRRLYQPAARGVLRILEITGVHDLLTAA